MVHVVVPRDSDSAVIELVELDRGTGTWGGSREGTPDAFGTAAEVLAALSSRPADDPRAAEVAAALDRENRRGPADGWRRPVLEVFQGTGQIDGLAIPVGAAHGLSRRPHDKTTG